MENYQGQIKILSIEKMRRKKLIIQHFFWVFYVLATVLEIQRQCGPGPQAHSPVVRRTHTHRVVRAACGASSRRGKSWLLQWAGEGRGCRQEWAKGPLLEGGNEGWRWLLLKYRGVSWIKEKEGQSFQREGTTKARAWRDASQYIAEWKDVCARYWIVRRQ